VIADSGLINWYEGPVSLLQCATEFGAGRDPAVVDALVESFLSFPGVRMIRRDTDPASDRTEASFVIDSSIAPEAAFRAFVEARERIDVTRSTAPLKPTGAVEVMAFVPLGDATMEGVTALAHKLGARVARELEIPVYYCGTAALRPERRDLDTQRRDEEGLRSALGASDVEREPDAGPDRPHKTAGLSVIGARRLRLRYNIELKTGDVDVARHIAQRLREHEGGLPGIRALAGLRESAAGPGETRPVGTKPDETKSGDSRQGSPSSIGPRAREGAQVRLTVADYTQVGLIRIYEEIERLAQERRVEIASSQLVGLVPRAALPPGTAERTRLLGFDPERQLVEEFLAR